MPKIIVWECTHTGTLFKRKGDYIIHLKRLAKQRHEDCLRKKKFEKTLELIQSVRSISDLEETLLQTCGAKVSFSRMRFSDKVSNTHSAPRNGVQNWWSKPELPRGYPGLSGSINMKGDFDFDLLRSLGRFGVHTGSGGGGTYEVRLYEADFIHLLDEEIIKDIIV